jgi:glucan phosphoethanolaminetransferase (alkaline phosphatase superfamily)
LTSIPLGGATPRGALLRSLSAKLSGPAQTREGLSSVLPTVFKGAIALNDGLHTTLSKLTRSGWQSNPAMKTLVDDYARYHYVLVVAGGCLALLFVVLGVVFWTRFKKLPKASVLDWSFEKKLYFSFGALSGIIALLITLLVAVNATNALDPVHGFSLLVSSAVTPSTSANHAFYEWIKSGNGRIPSVLQTQINERIKFQTRNVIIFGVLLCESVALSVILWRALLRMSRRSEPRQWLKQKTYWLSGSATVVASLFAMVVVLANMQGALAPVTITLLRPW